VPVRFWHGFALLDHGIGWAGGNRERHRHRELDRAANLTAAPRTGNIVIFDGYSTYYEPITEAGAACSLSLGRTGMTTGIAAATGSLALADRLRVERLQRRELDYGGDSHIGLCHRHGQRVVRL
jgi:hypothetical protein